MQTILLTLTAFGTMTLLAITSGKMLRFADSRNFPSYNPHEEERKQMLASLQREHQRERIVSFIEGFRQHNYIQAQTDALFNDIANAPDDHNETGLYLDMLNECLDYAEKTQQYEAAQSIKDAMQQIKSIKS